MKNLLDFQKGMRAVMLNSEFSLCGLTQVAIQSPLVQHMQPFPFLELSSIYSPPLQLFYLHVNNSSVLLILAAKCRQRVTIIVLSFRLSTSRCVSESGAEHMGQCTFQ